MARKARTIKLDPAVAKIRAERGLSTKIAALCNVSRQAVSDWRRVPPNYVLRIAPLIGMTPQAIRPDVFGKSPK
jgi:DNA-binding transcriptional regulator YdaS (Cro superfamily)